jgi:hypothetical protein
LASWQSAEYLALMPVAQFRNNFDFSTASNKGIGSISGAYRRADKNTACFRQRTIQPVRYFASLFNPFACQLSEFICYFFGCRFSFRVAPEY